MKELIDISWQVDEDTYRKDPSLSYSTIARYAKEGFNGLDNLFDKIETPSLSFGSAVDCLITDSKEKFDKLFLIANFPQISDTMIKIVKEAFNRGKDKYKSLLEYDVSELITITEELKYQLNWKPETRVKVIKEQGSEYYNLLYVAGDRKIMDSNTKEEVDNAVYQLLNSDNTKNYFYPDNPFDGIKRYYQLKFKATLDSIDYRCMADLIIVDYNNKVIQPIDLKTSSHKEWDFYQSFVTWRYDIQARLYWRIIENNLHKDPYFKDFKLNDYIFIVVNRKSLIPLIWNFRDTIKKGTLYYGKNKDIILEDPEILGKELSYYLQIHPKVPYNIELFEPNDITSYINKYY